MTRWVARHISTVLCSCIKESFMSMLGSEDVTDHYWVRPSLKISRNSQLNIKPCLTQGLLSCKTPCAPPPWCPLISCSTPLHIRNMHSDRQKLCSKCCDDPDTLCSASSGLRWSMTRPTPSRSSAHPSGVRPTR